jgi:hypothetical protein
MNGIGVLGSRVRLNNRDRDRHRDQISFSLSLACHRVTVPSKDMGMRVWLQL